MRIFSIALLFGSLVACKTTQDRSRVSSVALKVNDKPYFIVYESPKFVIYSCPKDAMPNMETETAPDKWKALCTEKVKDLPLDAMREKIRTTLNAPNRDELVVAKQALFDGILSQIEFYEKESSRVTDELYIFYEGLPDDHPDRRRALDEKAKIESSLDNLTQQYRRLKKAMEEEKANPGNASAQSALVLYDLGETATAIGRVATDLDGYVTAIMYALGTPTKTFYIDRNRQALLFKALTADLAVGAAPSPTPAPAPAPAPGPGGFTKPPLKGNYQQKPTINKTVIEPTSSETTVQVQRMADPAIVNTYKRGENYMIAYLPSGTQNCTGCDGWIIGVNAEGRDTVWGGIDSGRVEEVKKKVTGILRVEDYKHTSNEASELKGIEARQKRFLELWQKINLESVVYTIDSSPNVTLVSLTPVDLNSDDFNDFFSDEPVEIFEIYQSKSFPFMGEDLLNSVPKANRRKLSGNKYYILRDRLRFQWL